ncbi:lipoprotein [Rhizobium calliandrae]|uniref:Type IV secretion system putative lipoprotein virB7 n=1 Tax=Rhizobium calliandrae TaxID=1312182 RepID=A0ABT7KCE9_9HYPH|nr:lipoprotein [Rhizobium calliandrae]MDL2406151.1 lipoprotein [Rhizobium calliandrae]
MRKLLTALFAAAVLSGCQTPDEEAPAFSPNVTVTPMAAGSIAGDLAARLCEQLGEPAGTTIVMDKGHSDFEMSLEAALRGWGYAVINDGKGAKVGKSIELQYAIGSLDNQILARVTTPDLALGRLYAPSSDGAVPASALSITQRN